MTNHKKMKMSKYMPADLIRDILLRVRGKSLLRFSSGCKSWRQLIASTTFIGNHLALTKSTSDLFSLGDYSHFVGCCNGFLCVRITRFHVMSRGYMNPYFDVVLWNPSIMKQLTIQMRNSRVSHSPGTFEDDYCFGFGFDSISRVYKLLNMYLAECCLANGEWSMKVASYESLSWKYKHHGIPVFVNGKCHWLGFGTFPSTTVSVLSFDLHTREFREFVLPENVMEDYSYRSSLHVFKAYLSLFNIGDRGNKNCISLWIMKDYGNAASWTKVFASRNLTSAPEVVGFRARDEVMYCGTEVTMCLVCSLLTLETL